MRMRTWLSGFLASGVALLGTPVLEAAESSGQIQLAKAKKSSSKKKSNKKKSNKKKSSSKKGKKSSKGKSGRPIGPVVD